MDQADIATATCRHDGWTPERKALFLEDLAARGNVRAACARVGMSREAAYRLRRREALFARGWDAALLLARDSTADTFGDRAIDGIEEDVWYRGEHVGTRRRYDTRLMLAHMARLDKLVEQQARFGDTERFDEILACVAGVPVPETLAPDHDGLPPSRDRCVAVAEAKAKQRVNEKWAGAANEHGELQNEDYAAFVAEADAESERAGLDAAALWDEWHARACDAVDALQASGSSPGTVSNVSTSAAEMGPLSAQPEATRKG
jgi:hypothetical protein